MKILSQDRRPPLFLSALLINGCIRPIIHDSFNHINRQPISKSRDCPALSVGTHNKIHTMSPGRQLPQAVVKLHTHTHTIAQSRISVTVGVRHKGSPFQQHPLNAKKEDRRIVRVPLSVIFTLH